MDLFVGRQPILDAQRKLYGYELLFRNASSGNSAPVDLDGDAATSTVILGAITSVGLDRLVGDGLAFVNFPRNMLVRKDLVGALPPARTVIEVLESVPADAEVLEALRRLRKAGFKIALDDFVLDGERQRLAEIADFVKVDIRAVERGSLVAEVQKLRKFKVDLICEKVETEEEFQLCRELGFRWYQGWFFAKPDMLKGRHPESNRVTALRVISRLQDPDVEIEELADMVSLDASLAYALLRVVNSPLYASIKCLTSVQEAIVRMGLDGLRVWMSLITLAKVQHKPQALLISGVMRGRMCALIGQEIGLNAPDLFTIGLFSILDALFDQPIAALLAELPLTPATTAAIAERAGTSGKILDLVIRHERGEWPDVAGVPIRLRRLTERWYEALDWTHRAFGALSQNS